ncbi:hypothetical protein B0H66DRAFT_630865 [Apodospora peruviana]|uniref:Uncharacterized protein n=1 Tax=Apodospora peruviana TaxID=516989 RepID=A0AAE0HWP4_9PEZI|nr:hypothetical protein B0H66DRAFT_630865 [Apodospora peruviana]
MGAPVILCGKTEMIGEGVIAGLKPEYDVIHFILTPEAGATQIPAILKGEQSPPLDSALGTKDYSKPPIAVILGGGYDDAAIEHIMKAAPAPPLGPEYGKAMVARVKEVLAKLEKEGKLGEEKLQWY